MAILQLTSVINFGAIYPWSRYGTSLYILEVDVGWLHRSILVIRRCLY